MDAMADTPEGVGVCDTEGQETDVGGAAGAVVGESSHSGEPVLTLYFRLSASIR